MSSKYPILDNRPIDQWKVTELKEELKRRKLTIKGLKDDLIRRLDEALRIEQEALEAERENSTTVDDDNGLNLNSQPVNKNETQLAEVKNAEAVPVTEMVEHVDNIAIKNEKLDDVKVHVDINDSIEAVDEEILQEEVKLSGINTSSVEGELNVPAASMEIDPENVIAEIGLNRQDAQNSETQEVNENIQLENEKPKPQLEIVDAKPQLENEGLKHPPEEVMLDSSAPNNQVSEVTANLGFQVKCDSISTDSVSINEKIELKDNIIADNVKLELDVKPEMVEPSSSNVVAVSGESHPVDVEEPREKQPSVEEKDDNYATNADLSKKIECVDVGYSEKLNLDRSSGDDSMEEDVLESKQVDSKYNPDEVGGRSEKSVMPSVNEENVVDIVGKHLSTDQKRIHMENKIHPSVPVEKRKLNEQESMGSTEQLKRQRRWNSENIKIPEPQSSNIAPTTTPKDAFQHTPLRRNFSRSDSTASEDTPKERVVPPSQKPPTNSLRIDRFVRPFTLKAVQELLGKTGTVTSFWMDHIKTHCYVTYSSVEEAVETRNAVYNLQWPTNGGRLLVAEFVDPQEVKARLEAPPHSPATPVTPIALTPAALSTQQLQPSPRQQLSRQQLPPPPPLLPPPPPLSNPPLAKERIAHPPPPVLPEKHDPPIVTLDDLFRKTKATPRIYYLPLAEEQVAAKLAQQGKSTKQ